MLVAHASSTCDVCLDAYNEDMSYHSIPCGHVFCLPCLVSTSPKKCPLCRHEFSSYTMRKLHLTLPSSRDVTARKLEMKLVQSSPEMTLAESLTLFQEVQDWLEEEAQEDFLVLRAFAAVLCGFHETKDKLLQTQATAEKTEAALICSLEEARNAPNADVIGYKIKYKAAKSELLALRAEYAKLHAQLEKQRNIDVQAHYAQIQAQAQLQVPAQSEFEPAVRRISNPLPAPPRPLDTPFLKFFESSTSHSVNGKRKQPAVAPGAHVDPMTSAFVPTLSGSITTTKHSINDDGRSEVTTLVFKPPKRMPIWDPRNASFAQPDSSARPSPDPSNNFDSPRLASSVDGGGRTELPPPLATPDAVSETSGRSDNTQHARRSDCVSRPVSLAGAGALVEPLPSVQSSIHRASSPEASSQKQWHEPHKRLRQAHSILPPSSHPTTYPSWPETETLRNSVEPAPVPVAVRQTQRPAWQGGVRTSVRRASSPVIMHAVTFADREHATVTTDGQGVRDRHSVEVSSHPVGVTGDNVPPEKHIEQHQRRTSPSLGSCSSGLESEPEVRLPAPRVGRPQLSSVNPKESARASRHQTYPSHDDTQSFTCYPHVRFPSPDTSHGLGRSHSNPYATRPSPLDQHHVRTNYPGELSPTMLVNAFPPMDANPPYISPWAMGEV